jgi:hypothetical protein
VKKRRENLNDVSLIQKHCQFAGIDGNCQIGLTVIVEIPSGYIGGF